VNHSVSVVFDLDGTLIDSRSDLSSAANAALRGLGLVPLPEETIVSYVGDGIETLLRRCLTERHLEKLSEARKIFTAYYAEHLLDTTVLLPGVPETLEDLKGKYLLAVLTNKTEAFARKILEGLGVASFFEVVVGEADGKVPKPDPSFLRGIVEGLGGSIRKTLMVGDGRNDILVARNAGCFSCVVANSEEKENSLKKYRPDFIIHDIRELPAILRENEWDEEKQTRGHS